MNQDKQETQNHQSDRTCEMAAWGVAAMALNVAVVAITKNPQAEKVVDAAISALCKLF